MGKTYRGLTRVGNTVEARSGVDGLQWICDNVKKLDSTFQGYTGEGLDDIVEGLGTSRVESFNRTFYNSSLKRIPNGMGFSSATTLEAFCGGCTFDTDITLSNLQKVKTFMYAFRNIHGVKIITLNDLDAVTNMASLADLETDRGDILEEIHINGNTSNVTGVGYMCSQRKKLKILKGLNLINVSSNTRFLYYNSALEELEIFNIKKTLQIGSGTSWGHKLTDASLINTAKELWDLTGGTSQTLTVSTPSNARFDAIYVKLVTPTAEQIANDPYINNKKPCEVCESTDEGAMTLREYVVSKNWELKT